MLLETVSFNQVPQDTTHQCSWYQKNGSLRVVQDFREINAVSHENRYSMKTVNECIGDIGRAGSTIFFNPVSYTWFLANAFRRTIQTPNCFLHPKSK